MSSFSMYIIGFIILIIGLMPTDRLYSAQMQGNQR